MATLSAEGPAAAAAIPNTATYQDQEAPAASANGAVPAAPSNGISADEIALYDRQIRLWGVKAQEQIRSARILLITVKALGNEIAKNLVLAGVASVTLLDDGLVTPADRSAQFFLGRTTVGQNRAAAAQPRIQKLNPRVRVEVDEEGVRAKPPAYFEPFDVVIATDLGPADFNVINTAARLHGRAFYAAGTHGVHGFLFSDLIEHDFVVRKESANVPTRPGSETRTRSVVAVETRREDGRDVQLVTKRELYSTWLLASDGAALPPEWRRSKRRLRSFTPALSCLQALWEFGVTRGGRAPDLGNRGDLSEFTRLAAAKHAALGLPAETLRSEFLREFAQGIGAELAPVCALVGGQLAQDVINVLSRNQQPIQNMVVFDGNTMEASMCPLHPDGPLGRGLLRLADVRVAANGPEAAAAIAAAASGVDGAVPVLAPEVIEL